MLIGRFYHTLEKDGRLSLPKKFRELSSEWIVTRGLDGGLFGFATPVFAERMQALAERTFTRKAHRDFVRLMTNDAYQVSADALGRVQLPEYLIKFAHLTKETIVVGSYDHIEIWNQAEYHQYLDTVEPIAEEIAENLDSNDR